jgi:hypothetical protein
MHFINIIVFYSLHDRFSVFFTKYSVCRLRCIKFSIICWNFCRWKTLRQKFYLEFFTPTLLTPAAVQCAAICFCWWLIKYLHLLTVKVDPVSTVLKVDSIYSVLKCWSSIHCLKCWFIIHCPKSWFSIYCSKVDPVYCTVYTVLKVDPVYTILKLIQYTLS